MLSGLSEVIHEKIQHGIRHITGAPQMEVASQCLKKVLVSG